MRQPDRVRGDAVSVTETADSYFTRLDAWRFLPMPFTGGAWATDEQHISPMNGLIVHAVEHFLAERGPDDMEISRVSVDILGVLRLEPCDISVEVIRPGRTIELLEVVVSSGGRAAVRARVWRAVSADSAVVAGGEAEPLPAPETAEPLDLTTVWDGRYIDSVEVRSVGTAKPGRITAWLSTSVPLVANEAVSDLARLSGLVDTANGLSVRHSPRAWLFPNLDLTIHLLRRPWGAWLGLDTTVVFGPNGHGITSSVLHDTSGHIGYAQQTLTIRPRAAAE